MNLLHIDSSISGEGSASRQISAAVTAALARANPGLQIVRRDLDAEPIPHLDSKRLSSVRPSPDLPAPAQSDVDANAAILQEFLDADVLVIGAPMYNFGIPSQLKAWLDRILVAGKTFRYSQTGPVGLAGGKKVIVASARGGVYSPGLPNAANDFQETYLKAVFAFIGVDDVEFVRAEGVAYGPEPRAAALRDALANAETIAGLAIAA
jgi:FMN-dependent NADH-azoreductase